MRQKKDLFTPCVVRTLAHKHSCPRAHNGSVEDHVIVKSVRKLSATELSTGEIEELQINRPDTPRYLDVTVVDSAKRVVEDQLQNVELEIEMLNMRKRALKRRFRMLEKMSRSLHEEDQQSA